MRVSTVIEAKAAVMGGCIDVPIDIRSVDGHIPLSPRYMVALVIAGITYTVDADELKRAVDNATNLG